MKNYQGRLIRAWQVQILRGEMIVKFADSPSDFSGNFRYNEDCLIDDPDVEKLCEEVNKFLQIITRRFKNAPYIYDRDFRMWVIPGKKISMYGWSGKVDIDIYNKEDVITASFGYDMRWNFYTREECDALFDFIDLLIQMEWF